MNCSLSQMKSLFMTLRTTYVIITLWTFVDRIKGLLVWRNVTAIQNPSSSALQQNPDTNLSACPFSMLCAFVCQLINFAETLVQLGSFPLLPGTSPAPLDLCVADRSPRCSSAQKTACVCTFFLFLSRSLSLPQLDGCNMSEHLHSGGTSGRSASVTWLARRLFDRLRRPSPTNVATLSCWRAMRTSVHGNNQISWAVQTCKPREQVLPGGRGCWGGCFLRRPS